MTAAGQSKQFKQVYSLDQVGRIPAPGDNVAVAIRTLSSGTRILLRHLVFEMSHTVLEGHRFAVQRIEKGAPLTSWGLPFGLALRPLEPGEYICNEKILQVLQERRVSFGLPVNPNFSDHHHAFRLEPASSRAALPNQRHAGKRYFKGYQRNTYRGVGTRNYVVVMGTSSRTGPFVRQLVSRLSSLVVNYPNLDGIVPIDHTEGGGKFQPLNYEITLRTLAGFMVHPNVAAVLAVDQGNEAISNVTLQDYLARHQYPLSDIPHAFFTASGSFEDSLTSAEKIIRTWLPVVNQSERQDSSLEHLSLGLQCGGSDAFSGISGNPLVGILAREVVAYGGSANLAETDELLGAESYVLEKVRDLETAQKFLAKTERFQKWASWHGHSAEGNPSGGNRYRGLYNIAIKSIGAARKKDPATRLDYVIDFAQRMTERGFYFMDSPGNDLESIAGQAGAGCNLILFSTGNGSITNFPFVPTIKIMTTSARFDLVRKEMDFNAGRYLDGEALEDLGREAFEQMIEIASGRRSAGESAGHSQVQLWREWRMDATSPTPPKPQIIGKPFLSPEILSETSRKCGTEGRIIEVQDSFPQSALVLPTSLCSGQVALMIAAELNRRLPKASGAPTYAVALPHTEGCGNSAGESEELFMRTMAGYLSHPLVGKTLLLEHGCEKTHNDAFRNLLSRMSLPEENYGWVSVQLDGGIEKAVQKSLQWFGARNNKTTSAHPFSVAFFSSAIPENVRVAFELLAYAIAKSGGSVVIPLNSPFWPERTRDSASIDYGEKCPASGVSTMHFPTNHVVEILTGLGASGVQLIVGYSDEELLPANPLIPTIQVATRGKLPKFMETDVDLLLAPDESSAANFESLLDIIQQNRASDPFRARQLGNIAFQITRGYTGISL